MDIVDNRSHLLLADNQNLVRMEHHLFVVVESLKEEEMLNYLEKHCLLEMEYHR